MKDRIEVLSWGQDRIRCKLWTCNTTFYSLGNFATILVSNESKIKKREAKVIPNDLTYRLQTNPICSLQRVT